MDENNRYLLPLVRPGIRIIEAGCGNGKYVLAYAASSVRISVGLDFSHTFTWATLEYASQEKFKNVSVTTADIMNLPFEKDVYDVYSSFGVYEHFRRHQQRTILSEAYRILKPGGYIYVEVPHLWSLWSVRRAIRSLYRKVFPPTLVWQRNISRRSITSDMESCGFRVTEVHVLDSWSGFEAGLSLNLKSVKGIPNPFYYIKGLFQILSNYLDTQELFGNTLVYVGIKPVEQIS